ncbi:MAG: nuclear transport factor 2 family protein [Flavobacteriales bacterium]
MKDQHRTQRSTAVWALLIGAATFLGCTGQPNGSTMKTASAMKDTSVTVATLKEILDAFNRHDLDAIMTYFAEDCSFDFPRGPDPWGRRSVGKEQVREALASRFKGLPDVHYGEDSHWVAGNKGVSERTLTGTTVAGVRVKVRGCDLWEFRDGKIIRKDSYWKIVEG